MLSFEKVELFFPLTTKTNSVGLLEGSTVFHSVFTPQFDPQLELFLMTSASITSHVTCLGRQNCMPLKKKSCAFQHHSTVTSLSSPSPNRMSYNDQHQGLMGG